MSEESVKFENLEMHTLEQRKRIAELRELQLRKDRDAAADILVAFLCGALLATFGLMGVMEWWK